MGKDGARQNRRLILLIVVGWIPPDGDGDEKPNPAHGLNGLDHGIQAATPRRAPTSPAQDVPAAIDVRRRFGRFIEILSSAPGSGAPHPLTIASVWSPNSPARYNE